MLAPPSTYLAVEIPSVLGGWANHHRCSKDHSPLHPHSCTPADSRNTLSSFQFHQLPPPSAHGRCHWQDPTSGAGTGDDVWCEPAGQLSAHTTHVCRPRQQQELILLHPHEMWGGGGPAGHQRTHGAPCGLLPWQQVGSQCPSGKQGLHCCCR